MKPIVLFITVLLIFCLSACKEKVNTEIVLLNISNVYFNDNDGVYSNENGLKSRNGKLFSGNIVSLSDEKDTLAIVPFFNGLEEGWTRKWYSNKKPAEERLYHLGKKEGHHLGWWKNGNKKFDYNFVNGNHEGKAQTWYVSGQIASDNFYEKGYETGMQSAWYDDGVLRANYDARNGRQYGLTGVKNCASVFDSVTNKFVEKSFAKKKLADK